jgi:putative transcriptional regulator
MRLQSAARPIHIRMALSDAVREIRLNRGLTQSQLARNADVNQPTLNRIESGETADPSISVMHKIARALKTTVDEIIKFGERLDDPMLQMRARDFQQMSAGEQYGPAVVDTMVHVFMLPEAGAASSELPSEDLLATAEGGAALTQALQLLTRRVAALEAWKRSAEAPARKRA